MEKGQEALGQGDLMIRVPRETADEEEEEEEEEEEATNPWQFMLFDPRRVSRSRSCLFVQNLHHLLFQQAESRVPCRGPRFDKNSRIHLIF